MSSRRIASSALFLVALSVVQFAGCQKSAGAEGAMNKEGAAEKEYLHPSWALTMDELVSLTATLPKEIAEKVSSDPVTFLSLLREVLTEPLDLFIMADKHHELKGDYQPDDLVSLDRGGVAVTRKGLLLRKEAAEALSNMSAAAKASGIDLVVGSAYRSFAYQKIVYSRNVEELGQEAADRESARPGTSQHQLGTAVDFSPISDDFADTRAAVWLQENAHLYGFSLSYPEGYESLTGYRWEPWHYRYIGKAGASLVNSYFGGIQHYFIEFLQINGDTLRTKVQ